MPSGMDTEADDGGAAQEPEPKKAESAPEPIPEPEDEDEDPEVKAAKVRKKRDEWGSVTCNNCDKELHHQPLPVLFMQKKAAELKKEGTDEYKNKNFVKALELYSQAAELVPTDMVYLLNKGKGGRPEHSRCLALSYIVQQ